MDHLRESSNARLHTSRKFLERQKQRLKRRLRAIEDTIGAYVREQGRAGLLGAPDSTVGAGIVGEARQIAGEISDLRVQKEKVQLKLDIENTMLDSAKARLKRIRPNLAERASSTTADRLKQTQEEIARLQTQIQQITLKNETLEPGLQSELDRMVNEEGMQELGSLSIQLNENNVKTTYTDAGEQVDVPAISIVDSGDGEFADLGFTTPEDITGDFNIYGRTNTLPPEVDPQKVTATIELEKVGDGAEGGYMYVDGMTKGHGRGIDAFDVTVNGDSNMPSSLSYLGSSSLEEMDIASAEGVEGNAAASLTIGNSNTDKDTDNDEFPQNVVPTDMDSIDASDFLGDFNLGLQNTPVVDLTNLDADGGGDVTFYGDVNDRADYSYNTGSGSDSVNVSLSGNAVDTDGTGFSLSTSGGGDNIAVDFGEGVSFSTMDELQNLDISAGSGDDNVVLEGKGQFDIDAGSGSDLVNIDNEGGFTGSWTVGANSGDQPFQDRVLYQAKMTVSYAGFESTVNVPTEDNFVANQMDINEAIVNAIESNPELNDLLSTELETGNQGLTITSNQDGENELAIDLFQPTLVAEGDDESQSVLSSEDVDALGNGNGLVQTGEVARSGEVDEMSEVIEEVNEIAGSLNQDGESQNTDQFSNVFQGLDADNTADATGQSNVNFSTINPGSGAHDVLVLSSNDNSANTIEIDQSFDKVSVVNFFDNAALTEAGKPDADDSPLCKIP